jgi:hypothetical protein
MDWGHKMSRIRRLAVALAGVGLVLSASACTSPATTDTAAANEAYCASSKAVLSELSTLKDMVASGDSTRNEISDQAQVVVDAAVTAYRDSNNLSESVRADIQAADKAFRDAIRAIPSTTSTASEAAQAYKDAMDAYNASIDRVRGAQDC